VWGGARGWNADQFGRRFCRRPLVRQPACGLCGIRAAVDAVVVGTLLGPEGAEGSVVLQGFPVLVPPGRRGFLLWRSGVRRGRSGSVWLLVENCTVDASIF
jgi:hypothetical protein